MKVALLTLKHHRIVNIEANSHSLQMNTMTASEQPQNQPPSLARRLSIDSCDLYADVERGRLRRVKHGSSSRRSKDALDIIGHERLAPFNRFDFSRKSIPNSGTTSDNKPSEYEYECEYEYEYECDVASEAASDTNQICVYHENRSASNVSKTPLSGSNDSSQREGTGRKTSPADKSLSRSTTWSKSPKASKSGERSKSGDHSETIEKNLVTNVRSALERTERGSNFFTATQASRLPRFDVEGAYNFDLGFLSDFSFAQPPPLSVVIVHTRHQYWKLSGTGTVRRRL